MPHEISDLPSASPWVVAHCSAFAAGGYVLDLACGSGRHTRYLANEGFRVCAVDIKTQAVSSAQLEGIEIVTADLEQGPWPFKVGQFDGIVVVNYLWRALFPKLANTLKPGGVLIYDTFAAGNGQYGRPSNPDFLLRPQELKQAFADFDCLDYFEGYREQPKPAIRQSIVVRKQA